MRRDTFDGARLRAAREEKLMTMAELCRRAGISDETLRRAESKNHRPSRMTLLKIAHALGVTIEEITPDPAEVGGPT